MADLPLPLTPQQRLVLTAGDDPPPGWVWPSLALGTAWPALIAATRRDADLLRRMRPSPGPGRLGRLGELPGLPAAILVGSALVLAVVFGFVRLGIHDVYTESWLFLALALVLGMASPAAGLILVLGFIPMDLLASIMRGSLDPLLPALAGRATSWWLLLLLAGAVPLIAGQVPAAVLASTRPLDDRARRMLGYLAAMAVAAGLTWTWCAGTVELIRPVLTWSDALGNPSPSTTGPLLDGSTNLVAVATIAVLCWTLVRDTFRLVDDEADADVLPAAWPRILPVPDPRLAPARWALMVVVGLVLLGGTVTAPIDVVLLGAALLAARPGVHWVLRRVPVVMVALGQVPWVVRLAGGIALVWVVATVLMLVLAGPAFGSERFPIVVATAAGIVVLGLLLEVDAAADAEVRASAARAAAKAATGAAVAGALTVIGLLAIPGLALAQESVACPVGQTCLPAPGVSAAAATGAAALVVLSFGTAGRFVSLRRDQAARGAVPVAPGQEEAAEPGRAARGRAARRGSPHRGAWRLG